MTEPLAVTDIILATTTSTQDSGLLDVLLPIFEEQTDYRVKTIAVGTGQALALAGRGEADVVLVHAPELEKKYVEEESTYNRRLIMHNDFLLVGPSEDPAGVKGTELATGALMKIAETEALFVSRGDNSGTHFLETTLWEAAGIEPVGDWYIESGQGMGATLLIASEKSAYALSDRATYLVRKPQLHLTAAFEGDPVLLNLYSVMEVNPEKFEKINAAGARSFADFMLSEETQSIIREFGVNRFGEPLFYPDAGKTEDQLVAGI